jgi:hypothetical protein
MADEEKAPMKVTDIDAATDNIKAAVMAFCQQWEPAPKFAIGVEVMGVAQLRDAMGLRASIDWGDPWPAAEKQLLDMGFRWQMLSGMRVMYLREKDGFVPDTGWEDAEEYEE